MSLARTSQPTLDPSLIHHSQQLIDLIKAEITATGPMNFARYMELALYAPGLGYYSAGLHKFGAAGDFVTAPEISPLFSRCLARQCHQVLTTLSDGNILEFGAGSGVMAADLLLELETLGTLPQHYYILEISADLKQRQQQLLQHRVPQFYDRFIWLDALPAPASFQGVILANEVLDAMPVHKFKQDAGIQEYYVNYQENQLIWQTQPACAILETSVLKLDLMDGYESEINLNLSGWLTSVNQILKRGLILLVDYGFPRHEYYHPNRGMGTLMCHHRHQAHSDPLLMPGLQDITAHVDFTALAEAADENQLHVAGYTTQANFLLSCGLTDLVQDKAADTLAQIKIIQQIKKLTLPSEMGELFKVMALTRNFDSPLLGFYLHDMREKL